MPTTDLAMNRNVTRQGLTREKADTRLRQYGPNAVQKPQSHRALSKQEDVLQQQITKSRALEL